MGKANSFLSRYDLDIEGVALKHEIMFTTKNELPVPNLKDIFKTGYEMEGCRVFHIEGGKVE